MADRSPTLRTLLIDNYDSYTYNLFQLIAEVNGVAPDVIYNNQLTWEKLYEQLTVGRYDNIVISPGPGTPDCPADVGVCAALLAADVQLPILGVCMGMQALAVANGATVHHAPEPIHGRLSQIQHTNHRLFQDIPSGVGAGFAVVRYHSLAIDELSLPAHLQPIAWTCGSHQPLRAAAALQGSNASNAAEPGHAAAHRVLQAIAHVNKPHYGVQFHPESIGSGFGRQLMQNFHDMTAEWHGYQMPGPPATPTPSAPGRAALSSTSRQQASGKGKLAVRWHKLAGQLGKVQGAEALFMHLYGQQGAQNTFWLDSSASDRGRFSYMGGRGGRLWQRISYQLPPPLSTNSCQAQTVHQAGGQSSSGQHDIQWEQTNGHVQPQQQQPAATDPGLHAPSPMQQDVPDIASVSMPADNDKCHTPTPQPGVLTIEDVNGSVTQQHTSVWDFLRDQLFHHQISIDEETAQQLPFDFWGGFVGYLGYELKAECGGDNAHQAPTPDAAMFLADRLIAIDHHRDDVYLVALSQPDSDASEVAAQQWLQTTRTLIYAMQQPSTSQTAPSPVTSAAQPLSNTQSRPLPASQPATGDTIHRTAQAAEPSHDQTLQGLSSHAEHTAHEVARGEPGQASVGDNASVKTALEGTLARHRAEPNMGSSSSSLAASSQTHQHMDATSSDAAMSDDDWSHRDQRGSFASLDSVLTDHSMHLDPQHHQQHQEPQHSSHSMQSDQHQRHQEPQHSSQGCSNQPCQAAGATADSAGAGANSVGAGVDSAGAGADSGEGQGVTQHQSPPFKLARSKQQYLKDVATCQQALYDGDSYEICLTTALVRPHPVDALHLYRTLRKVNPAPYAAWMSFGADQLQICCSSPERFLRGGRGGILEARPIKGTAPRSADPETDRAAAIALANSEKDQAENLMIVDLLRNDLGRVCEVGSVHVPGLMEVESFATVHQLVSTIRGKGRPDVSLIDAIKAAFPGGSMTGAPKVRSMQILDTLEKQARGIYSGSVGFIGFNDTCDLNIVIRTAVVHGGVTRIGAGGAIVVQSDVQGEYEEMRLKAMALLKAVSLSEGQDPAEAIASVDVGEG